MSDAQAKNWLQRKLEPKTPERSQAPERLARHASLNQDMPIQGLRKLAKEMDRRTSFNPRSSTRAVLQGLRSLMHPLEEAATDVDQMDDDQLAEFFNPGQKNFREAADVLARRLSQHKPWFLINPEGWFRRIWDSIAAIMTYFVILYVPVLMAYYSQDCCTYVIADQLRCNPRSVPGANCGDLCQLFALAPNYFFAVDIVLNFFTGYEAADGGMEYALPAIWKNYVTTWFALDLISCFPMDCILTSAANSVNWYNSGQYIRCLRVFAINRRARGSPFRWVDAISDVRKEFSYSARRIINSAVLTLIGLHYFACFLWFVVRVQDYPDVTWPVQLAVIDEPVGKQYLWSIFNTISGMIGLGYGAFPPRTWLEALVWCFAMITLASLFAVVNGFILASILSSATARQKYKERMDLILAATRSRELPEALRDRILAFFKYKYMHRPLQDESSLWQELPGDMQAQVALASTSALLQKVPIFARDQMLLERVALLLRPAYAIAGQEIVRQGWPASTMFFVRRGFVDLHVEEQVADTLSDGQYFGEAALLLMPSDLDCREKLKCEPEKISFYTDAFTTVVGAKALTNCKMFALDGPSFHALVEDYPTALEEIKSLSLRYAERVKQTQGAVLSMNRAAFPSSPPGGLGGLGSARRSTVTFSRVAAGGLLGRSHLGDQHGSLVSTFSNLSPESPRAVPGSPRATGFQSLNSNGSPWTANART